MTPPSWSSVILPSSRFRAESVIRSIILATTCGVRPLERCGEELLGSVRMRGESDSFQVPAKLMSTTEQTSSFAASSILLRRGRATTTTEKSGSGIQGRGIYRSVSLGNEKTIESGKITGARGTVVGRGPRSPAVFPDTGAPCDCVSAPAQRPSDNTSRFNAIQAARPIRLWAGNLYYLPGLRAKIRVRPQGQTAGRLLGHP
jgi:hypothetical protein